MASKSIAEELFSLVSPYNYRSVIPCLTTDDFVPIQVFQRSHSGKLFNIKGGHKRDGKVNYEHLYEIFGRYSGETADAVWDDVLEQIKTSQLVCEQVGQIFFARWEWSFNEWAVSVCSHYYYGDELLLFTLCCLFHRHAVIICTDKNWSTLEPEGTMMVETLLNSCDLHFVYLKPGLFSELVPKKKVTSSASPPEFPNWTSDQSSCVSISQLPGLEGFVGDSALLKTFLNICDNSNDTRADPAIIIASHNPPSFPEVTYTNGNDVNNDLPVKGRNHKGNMESPIKGGNDNTTPLGSLKGRNSSDSDDATILLSMPSPDTTISYGNDLHSVASMLSPISLKHNCIQVLLENTVVLQPPSLYHLCVDFMAWNHDVYYNNLVWYYPDL